MKTVLIDMFGVASSEGHFKRNVLHPMCPKLLEAQTDRYYKELEFERISEKEFWEKAGWDPVEGRLKMLEKIPIDPKLREVVAYLKRKNYVTVLFSDFSRIWLDAIVKKNRLAPLFDKVVATPAWGYNKNNMRLYEEAKKQFGDCVMVDDNIRWLAIANRVGMETIWKKSAEEEASFEPDHVIRYLEELKEIL